MIKTGVVGGLTAEAEVKINYVQVGLVLGRGRRLHTLEIRLVWSLQLEVGRTITSQQNPTYLLE